MFSKLITAVVFYSMFALGATACEKYTSVDHAATMTLLGNGNFRIDDAAGSREYASISASTGYLDPETGEFSPALRAGVRVVDGKMNFDLPGVRKEGSGHLVEIDGVTFAPACH